MSESCCSHAILTDEAPQSRGEGGSVGVLTEAIDRAATECRGYRRETTAQMHGFSCISHVATGLLKRFSPEPGVRRGVGGELGESFRWSGYP
jgi:hypothetical protein